MIFRISIKCDASILWMLGSRLAIQFRRIDFRIRADAMSECVADGAAQ
ncbi:hypothetical protein [Burkholderia thailandensis]|uniref:Uncharacterized protein n=1 Tax=Burkholderia thailandensis (strain ATCC 700388 / DSM 13276 / CCUG 48851 / CIP 106301 / E264) TaxID=271848 RepID=Q2STX8_BURTA|nr:hypothetical protein [Burkholderia thailandensis]ABC39232.1 hypothetical protein BTH_I3126 [Burkholderia thailandensis E264]